MANGSGARGRRFPFGWLIAGLIVGIAAFHYVPKLIHSGDAPPPAMAALPVNVVKVEAKNIIRWSEASGQFEAVSAAEIRPQVSGVIQAVHFTDGSEVKRGQKLFTIDPRPYEAAMLSAKGTQASAQSVLDRAKLDIARAKKLRAMKAISQAEFETRTDTYQGAAGNLDAARGAVHTAEVNLGYTAVTAPITGRISRAEVTPGNLVEAGANAPLLASIVNLAPIYASFDLDEHTFLSTIQGVPASQLKNVPVEVGLANQEGTPLKAVVHDFDNQITPGSGTIRVRAMLPNTDKTLVPGLFARVRIGASDETPAIMINPVAIGTDQSKKFVMVVGEGNKAEYREVTLGAVQDGQQIITTGLKEGELVLVSRLQVVQPGAVVTPTEVDPITLQPPGGEAAPEAAAK
ncbi:MAG: efflux RND transporter periplasmic adaptor subunit [Rickettsiales bacterium]